MPDKPLRQYLVSVPDTPENRAKALRYPSTEDIEMLRSYSKALKFEGVTVAEAKPIFEKAPDDSKFDDGFHPDEW